MSILENTRIETENLVERCRKGDSAAFDILYQKYAKAMYNTALRICGSPEDAEDILQESFIAAFNALKTLTKNPVFGAWLRSIVVNRSLDFIRTKKRKGTTVQFFDEADAPTNEDQTTDDEPDYTVQEIQAAINELPDGFRIVLCLYLFENLNHREIAANLGISEGTSKSQYARAKKKLIEIILSKRQNHAR